MISVTRNIFEIDKNYFDVAPKPHRLINTFMISLHWIRKSVFRLFGGGGEIDASAQKMIERIPATGETLSERERDK